ncbi:MAG: type II toxin-antitoxin system Phd/YefM family antitoxin [Rhodospirillales bacterium]|nr:type II toxin-antitoxin system Phd/YefM family antitoxin [Rhodospirillales bacterium]
MTANDAKRHFGRLLDEARREPISVQKHGRPVAVVLSVEDYDDFERIKRERLTAEVRAGLDELDRGEGMGVDAAGLDVLVSGIKAEGRRNRAKMTRAD